MEHTALPAAQPAAQQEDNNHSLVGETNPYTEPHERLMADTDVEVVNRASGDIQPFSKIEKRASTTSTGNITGYGVEIYDPSHENDWRGAGNVGRNYLLVDNREVVEVAQRIIEASPFAQAPRKVFFDGKRFVYSLIFPSQDIEGPRGDDVTFGLQFRNSYNGSMKFRAELYAERLVCENGMTSKDHFAQHTFRHTLGNERWDEEVEEAMSVLRTAPDRLDHFVSDLYALENTEITNEDVMSLRSGSNGLGKLPVSRFGEVYDQLIEETEARRATAYDVLNAATNVLWHRDRSVKDLEYNEGVVNQLTNYAHAHQN
jgi:hypothetical protein